jgi:hypothetical protein
MLRALALQCPAARFESFWMKFGQAKVSLRKRLANVNVCDSSFLKETDHGKENHAGA